jgi:predicted branched-subunit amino acid permease
LSDISVRNIRITGILDAANVPGFALGSTMMGFAAIARESGFDFWMTFFTSLGVWGMPGQVAFVSLYATGASIFLMFVATALANMRMMLMVISGSDILRLSESDLPLWKRVLMMHLLAITSWAQISYKQNQYSPADLRIYYMAFSLTIFAFGMTGTSIGYFLNDLMAPEILRLVIFITPIYILLLLMNAQQSSNRLAAVLGGAVCPFIYGMAGDWAILLSGFIGGSGAIALFQLRAFFIRQGGANG